MSKTLEEIGEMIAKGMNVKANIIPMIDTDSEDILLSTDGIENEMPVLPLMDQVLLPDLYLRASEENTV